MRLGMGSDELKWLRRFTPGSDGVLLFSDMLVKNRNLSGGSRLIYLSAAADHATTDSLSSVPTSTKRM